MRLVVVDDYPTTCLGVKGLLLATDIRVMGECGHGEEALRLVEEARPDLVILGLNMAGGEDAIGILRQLKSLPEPPRVLIYSAFNLAENVASCLLARADSYIHKSAGCKELLSAIRRTAAGEHVWPLGHANGEAGAPACTPSRGIRLTPKEQEILILMLDHYSNAEIARKLYLSLTTVKTHVRHVLKKLGARNRKEILCQSQPPPRSPSAVS